MALINTVRPEIVGKPGTIKVHMTVDIRPIEAMVETFTRGLNDALTFSEGYILGAIRNEVFDTFVRRLVGSFGGEGWSEIYTEHLISVLQTLPIKITITGQGGIEVLFNLDRLGSYEDLRKGLHMGALTEGNETGSGHAERGNRKHHGYNPHPARIELPYANQSLLAIKERRQAFWKQVIEGRDMSFPLRLRKGKDVWTYGELIEYLGYPPPPTVKEIHLARVMTWKNKAPEWLLLENGFSEAEVLPHYFSQSLGVVTNCVAGNIFLTAIKTLKELSEQQGILVGSSGIPYEVIPGRGASFAKYSKTFSGFSPDYSKCFGEFK